MIVKKNKGVVPSKLPKIVIRGETTQNVATILAKLKGQKKPSKEVLNLLNNSPSRSTNNCRKHAK